MELLIARDELLQPLQFVANVVERKQTIAVLANILCIVADKQLTIIGTDCEVELTAYIPLLENSATGKFTLPARKLLDICRSLPGETNIKLTVEDNKATLSASKSRFALALLPADNFPSIDIGVNQFELTIAQEKLKNLFERIYFCMAQQDVRYFLNGLLLDCRQDALYAVATNGHRLASSFISGEIGITNPHQCIIPRKAVIECLKLLNTTDTPVNISAGQSHIRFELDNIVFTSKLIDGKFPNYARLIPKHVNKVIIIDRDQLKQMFSRVSILANEKYHGVRVQIRPNLLRASTNNPEQEIAEEELVINYDGEEIELGFNVNYLIDVLNSLPAGDVRLSFTDANSCLLMESQAKPEDNCAYIVMPMRL